MTSGIKRFEVALSMLLSGIRVLSLKIIAEFQIDPRRVFCSDSDRFFVEGDGYLSVLVFHPVRKRITGMAGAQGEGDAAAVFPGHTAVNVKDSVAGNAVQESLVLDVADEHHQEGAGAGFVILHENRLGAAGKPEGDFCGEGFPRLIHAFSEGGFLLQLISPAPKVLAFHKAEVLSLAVGWVINLLYVVMKPLIHVMKLSSNALLWLFGQRDLAHSGEGHFTMTVEEIRMILSASEKDGMLEPEETQMIRGVFDLDERTVRDAMVPRTQIYGLSSDKTLADALRMFRDVPHARFPVYHESIDHIVGIVAIKELLGVMAESSGQTLEEVSRRPVLEFVNEPFIVPNSKPLSEMLKEFKRARQQMAIVIDEYGGTEGVITLEDILEEIVGDYEDEFTHQRRRVRKLEGSQYEIDASMRVSDLEPLIHYPFPLDAEYVTLAGLIYKQLGRVPKTGESIDIPSARLVVMEMDNHRITKVRFEDLALNDDGSVSLADDNSPADK